MGVTPFETVLMAGNPQKASGVGGLEFDAGALDRDPGLILEALGQGVCVCDLDGRILWGNRLFRAFPDGVQRRVAVVCRRIASSPEDVIETPEGSARPRRRSLRMAAPGTGQFFEVIAAPLISEDSHDARSEGPLRLVAVVSDVTAQESLRRKIVAINRAGRELVHLDAETVRGKHVAERLTLLETKVVRSAHELLSFDHFVVRLLDHETNRLDVVMAAGVPARACSLELFAKPEGNGISGLVASTGKAYICPDVEKDSRYVYGLDTPGSSLTVPLKLFDRVIGVFNVESAQREAFSDSDRHLSEIFGHYIAMALHILNLLVVERYTTSQSATGAVQGELSEPLNDLIAEAEAVRTQTTDPEVARHVDRILKDVDSIRRRIKNVARGPSTILGIEDAIERSVIDPVLEGKRVLVVDNEQVMRDTIRDVLTARGCSVTICDDGDSAQKLLLQWELSHDADLGYDLVLSDINLGDKTGYDVFAAAKSARANLPVILMTGFGYDPHHSIVRASQEGLQCVLFKPFQVETLMDEVRKALSGPATIQ